MAVGLADDLVAKSDRMWAVELVVEKVGMSAVRKDNLMDEMLVDMKVVLMAAELADLKVCMKVYELVELLVEKWVGL